MKELLLRALWAVIEPVFFRYSPRIFYGWRNLILRAMGARLGKGVQIYPSARIAFPWLLRVDEGAVISWHVRVYNLGPTRIGRNAVVSQYAHLCGGDHDYRSDGFPLLRKGLAIGDNVWIGADAFIGPGVTVHEGALVAARAVVMKDVEKRTLVAGNPAQIIKKLDKNARV